MAEYVINPNDIVEVTVRMQLFEQVCLSVLHYQFRANNPATNGRSALNQLCTDLSAAGSLIGNYKNAVTSQVYFKEIRCQVVYPSRRPYSSKALSGTGSSGGVTTAPNIALVGSKVASQVGRGRTGSIHIPGPDPTGAANGEWGDAAKTAAAPLFAWMLTVQTLPGGTDNLFPVVWSRVKAGSPSDLDSIRIKDEIRTMHRRTLHVGQ